MASALASTTPLCPFDLAARVGCRGGAAHTCAVSGRLGWRSLKRPCSTEPSSDAFRNLTAISPATPHRCDTVQICTMGILAWKSGDPAGLDWTDTIVSKSSSKLPSPVEVGVDLFFGGWRTFVVASAVELDVFTAISSGAATVVQIAGAANAHEPAMRRLLDALVALKYLTHKGERYALTSQSATFLVRGVELYMEGIDRFATFQMMGWTQLTETIRTGKPGKPSVPTGDDVAAAEFFATLVKCMFPLSFVGGKAAVASLSAAARARIRNILDVAAGSGAWSIPFAQANHRAQVTVVDFPQVTPVTREYTARFKVSERYRYLEGNLRELDFGTGYDLVILGHVIHGEGREAGRYLVERSAAALNDRGMLLIAEMIPNDERTGPPYPMLFGINMLLHTAQGDVFTMKEYREWLKAAAFKGVQTIRTPMVLSPLILARK